MVGKMFKRLLQVLLVVALLTLAFGFAFYALLAPISNVCEKENNVQRIAL
eukprot:m.52290 g.52290  ORF g.52290 m.52290 type:complete len:50 (+) comp34199_c0_seq10:2808-2957(+)